MERGSHDLSSAESTSGGGDEKYEDTVSSHSVNESLTDEEELSDSESTETISVPQKETGRYYTDLSYLNNLLKQERRRIEEEIIKGHKPGECLIISRTIMDQHMT